MRRRRAIVLAWVLVGASCTSAGDLPDRRATDTTADPVSEYDVTLVDADCATEVPPDVEVTCSTLTLPEDRSRPEGRTVVLPIVRIHSTAAEPAEDPVIFLHGGPGDGTLAGGIRQRSTYPTLENRDLILFDQRGAGAASPSLECPEREAALTGLLQDDESIDDAYNAVRTAVEECHTRLLASGVDLSRYSTPDAAADVADLATALGVDSYNLWGVSYGTRLALEVMRSHPEGVRTAVLDSAYAPGTGSYDDVRSGFAQVIEGLSSACANEVECHRRVDDLQEDIRRVVTDLDARNFTQKDGEGDSLVVTGDDVVSGLFVALYDTSLIPLLPGVIHSMARENYQLIPLMATQALPVMNDTSEGAYLSYECADNARLWSTRDATRWREETAEGSLLLLAGWYLMCDVWDVEPTPDSFDDPVDTDISTLVIAGEFDPITSAANSEKLASSLPRSLFVEVPRGGHTPGAGSSCVREVIASFVSTPDRTNRSCIDSQDPPPFVF